MSMITKFAGRDPGDSARIVGFVAHLRAHGFSLGVAETQAAVQSLCHIQAGDPSQTHLALKAVCASSQDEAERFEALFDSYWRNAGRVREKVVKSTQGPAQNTRNSQTQAGPQSGKSGSIDRPDNSQDGAVSMDGEGRLIATGIDNLMKKGNYPACFSSFFN